MFTYWRRWTRVIERDGMWPEPSSGYAYIGDAHIDALDAEIETCYSHSPMPGPLGKLSCTACAVDNGLAVMISWNRRAIADDRTLGDQLRALSIAKTRAAVRRSQSQAKKDALVLGASVLDQWERDASYGGASTTTSRILALIARVRDLQDMCGEYEREVVALGFQLGLTDGADWEPLGENIQGHCVLPMREPHKDGRLCVHHHRLDAWVFDNEKKCLREHPDVLELMTRQPARDGECLVPGACPDPKTGMPCNNCWLAERSTIPPNPFK